VPLFSCVDGQVSCFYSRQNLAEAARQGGRPLDPAFAAAADHFEVLAQDRRFMMEFMLEPGEIMLANNYVLLRARTEFEDSERYTRDLLRLWLDSEALRRVIPRAAPLREDLQGPLRAAAWRPPLTSERGPSPDHRTADRGRVVGAQVNASVRERAHSDRDLRVDVLPVEEAARQLAVRPGARIEEGAGRDIVEPVVRVLEERP